MTISLTKSSIGYDLRECGQAVTLDRRVTEVTYNSPDDGQEHHVVGAHNTILAILHSRGYSAQFSESDKEIPRGFLKHVAATNPESIYSVEPKRVRDNAVETCDPADAEFWGVYEKQGDGLPMHLEDFTDLNDAQMFALKCRDEFNSTGRRRYNAVCSECGWEGETVHFHNGLCGGCRNSA